MELLQNGVPLKEAVLKVGYETERGFLKAAKLSSNDFIRKKNADADKNG